MPEVAPWETAPPAQTNVPPWQETPPWQTPPPVSSESRMGLSDITKGARFYYDKIVSPLSRVLDAPMGGPGLPTLDEAKARTEMFQKYVGRPVGEAIDWTGRTLFNQSDFVQRGINRIILPYDEKIQNDLINKKRTIGLSHDEEEHLHNVMGRVIDAKTVINQVPLLEKGDTLLSPQDMTTTHFPGKDGADVFNFLNPLAYADKFRVPGVIGDVQGAIAKVGNEGLAGLTSPGNLLTLPFAATKPVQAAYLATTAPASIEELIKATETGGPEQKEHLIRAGENTLLSALIGAGLARTEPRPTPPILPTEMRPEFQGPPSPIGPQQPYQRAPFIGGPLGEGPAPQMELPFAGAPQGPPRPPPPPGGEQLSLGLPGTLAEAIGRPEAPPPPAAPTAPPSPAAAPTLESLSIPELRKQLDTVNKALAKNPQSSKGKRAKEALVNELAKRVAGEPQVPTAPTPVPPAAPAPTAPVPPTPAPPTPVAPVAPVAAPAVPAQPELSIPGVAPVAPEGAAPPVLPREQAPAGAQPPVIAKPGARQRPGRVAGGQAPVGITREQVDVAHPQLRTLLENMLRRLRVGERTGDTAKNYNSALYSYGRYLVMSGDKLNDPNSFVRWQEEMSDPESPLYTGATTRDSYRGTLSTMFDELSIQSDPNVGLLEGVRRIPKIAGESQPIPSIPHNVATGLFDWLRDRLPDTPMWKKRSAALHLQYDSAARGGALGKIKVKDYNRDAGTVRLYADSPKSAYTISLEPQTRAILDDYLESSGRINMPEEPMFVNETGGAYTRDILDKALKAALDEAGLPSYSTHGMRSSRLTQLHLSGREPYHIMKRAGWKDLRQFDTYVKPLSYGGELSALDPQTKGRLAQIERMRNDPEGQRWLQSRYPYGEGARPDLSKPFPGEQAPEGGGVLQAPKEGEVSQPEQQQQVGPGGGRTPGDMGQGKIPQLGDFRRMEQIKETIQGLLKQARESKDPAERAALYESIAELQRQHEEIVNRHGGRGRTTEQQSELDKMRRQEGQQQQAGGDRIKPEDLRPAVNVGGRILVGEVGDTHADILQRNGINPDTIPHPDPRRGFVDVNNPTELLNRTDAARRSGLRGTADAGGLDSMDLPLSDIDKQIADIDAQFPEDTTVEEPPKPPDEERGQEEQQQQAGPQRKPPIIAPGTGVPPVVKNAGVPLPDEAPPKLSETVEGAKELLKSVKATPFERPRGVASPVGRWPSEVGYAANAGLRLRNALATAGFNASRIDKYIMPIDAVLDALGGGSRTYDNPLFQVLRWPLDVAFNREVTRRNSYLQPIIDLQKQYKLDQYNGQRIGVYAHAQQEGGVRRMLESGIKQADIDHIVKTITPKELTVYNEMRRLMDSSLPEVQRIASDLYDRDVEAVENYFPWLRQWQIYEKGPIELIEPSVGGRADPGITHFEELRQDYNLEHTVETDQGFTIERLPRAKGPIQVNAFDIYHRHMRDVAHFIEMQEDLNRSGKIARSKEFREQFGDAGQNYIMNWLNTVATQGRSTNRLMWLDGLRKYTTIGVIGGRLASQFVHGANTGYVMQRIANVSGNPARGVTGWAQAFGDAVNAKFFGNDRIGDFLREHFQETYERGGGELDIPFAELSEKGVLRGKVTRGAFWIQKTIDQLNAQAAVLGVYKEHLRAKGLDESRYLDLPFDQEAASRAIVAARRAVASPLPKDIPLAISRGGSLARLALQFQNTFLDQWSNIRYDMAGTAVKAASDVAKGELGKGFNEAYYAGGAFVASVAMLAADTLIKQTAQRSEQAAAGYEPRQKKGYWERFWHEAARRVPGYTQAESIIKYGEPGVPALGVVTEGGKALYHKAIGDEPDPVLGSLRIAESVGEAAGIPFTSQAGSYLENLRRGALSRRGEYEMRKTGSEMFPGTKEYDLRQRLQIGRRLAEERPPETIQQRKLLEQRGAAATAARREELTKLVSPEHQDFLDKNKLYLEGYKNTLQSHGTTIQLTREEQDRYRDYLVEEYNKFMDSRQDLLSKLERFPSQKMKTDWWAKMQTQIHKQAEVRLERSIQQGARQSPKSFSVYQENE